jgi:hypothetical protein
LDTNLENKISWTATKGTISPDICDFLLDPVQKINLYFAYGRWWFKIVFYFLFIKYQETFL